MADSNCIFCKIISKQTKGHIVLDEKFVTGVLDINPCTKGHTLLLPKEHQPIMQLLTPESFHRMFGLMPKIIKAMKDAMIVPAVNLVIANGAAAGQQSPHFLAHLIPREKGDGLDKYAFDKKGTTSRGDEVNQMLAQNLPLMMQSHFQRFPAKWHTGDIKRGKHIHGSLIYEDECIAITIPEKQFCDGHIVLYSQEGDIIDLTMESSIHLFYGASYAATAAFEGLGAQGSNIILKTGETIDNPSGVTKLHVIPRYENDGLDLTPKPGKAKDLDGIQSKLRDKMFLVEHACDEEEKCEVFYLDNEPEEIDEISMAIEQAKNI